jgi:hypothetical protein
MIEGKTKEETIRLTAEAYGIPEIEAAFIYAQEHGEIDSDENQYDEDGNFIPPSKDPRLSAGPTDEEQRPVPPPDEEPDCRVTILDDDGNDVTAEVYRPSHLFD